MAEFRRPASKSPLIPASNGPVQSGSPASHQSGGQVAGAPHRINVPQGEDATAQDEKNLIEFLQSDEAKAIIEHGIKSGQNPTDDQPLEYAEVIGDAVAYISDKSGEDHQDLVKCLPMSIVNAVAKLAASGLTLNRNNGYGFLLPTWNKDLRCHVAAPIPGIRGMEAKVGPFVTNIYAAVIRRQDTETQHIHPCGAPFTTVLKNFRAKPDEANDIVGAVCNIHLRDGTIVAKDLRVSCRIEDNKEKYYVEDRKRPVKTGYMGAERSLEYSARRAALKEWANTVGKSNKVVSALFEMETESYDLAERGGEGASTAAKATSAANAAPVEELAPEIEEPKQTTNPVDTIMDRVAAAGENGLDSEHEEGAIAARY